MEVKPEIKEITFEELVLQYYNTDDSFNLLDFGCALQQT
jgi:hypothetical protein